MQLRALISICLLGILSGCVPYVSKYTKIYGPEVTNSGYGCAADFNAQIYGAVQSENISYYIQIDPGHQYRSNLEVTADVDLGVVIPEPSIKIFGSRGKLISEMVIDKPASRIVPDLKAKTKDSKLLRYTFRFPEHPRFKRNGSIQLPDIVVMGELREGIILKFKQAIKVGILPFNC